MKFMVRFLVRYHFQEIRFVVRPLFFLFFLYIHSGENLLENALFERDFAENISSFDKRDKPILSKIILIRKWVALLARRSEVDIILSDCKEEGAGNY